MEKLFGQPFKVAEVFTGMYGAFVPLEDSIAGFKSIMDGDVDAYPEQAVISIRTKPSKTDCILYTYICIDYYVSAEVATNIAVISHMIVCTTLFQNQASSQKSQQFFNFSCEVT